MKNGYTLFTATHSMMSTYLGNMRIVWKLPLHLCNPFVEAALVKGCWILTTSAESLLMADGDIGGA